MTVIVGDCRDVMSGMDESSIDAIVCDPPYGLEFMGKEWDRLTEDRPNAAAWKGRRGTKEIVTKTAESHPGTAGTPWVNERTGYRGNTRQSFKRCTKCGKRSFSGSPCKCPDPEWAIEYPEGPPTGAVVMQRWHESWAVEAFRVLKPGGHLLAFGGTRTFHRLTVAIEDAGFEIRDCLSWLYGSGFPKSLDVSKAIDKMAGAEREVIGTGRSGKILRANGQNERPYQQIDGYQEHDITAPATPEAAHWAGWGTALKPAHEPIIVARKPADIRYNLRSLVPTIEEQLCKVDTFAKTATYLSELLQTSGFSNIASLLKECLAVLLNPASRYTTETATALITDLTTLRSYLSALTPSSTTPDATEPNGIASNVWFAVAISASVVAKCERLVSITAGESATDQPVDQDSDPEARLRPNWEPVIVARKPLVGTVAANVLAHGTGALNIDACRIAAEPGRDFAGGGTAHMHSGSYGDGGGKSVGRLQSSTDQGRWPANVCLDESAAALLDEMSGERKSGVAVQRNGHGGPRPSMFGKGKGGGLIAHVAPDMGYGDTGGASRYFKVVPLDDPEAEVTRFGYFPKASRRERNAGLEGMPERLANRYSPKGQGPLPQQTPSEGVVETNHHPTVKPIALMRWLVRLVTPPGGTVLDPFAGSGSTGCAAVLEGFDFIGIEQSAEYAEIAERRIAFWRENGDRPVKASTGTRDSGVYANGKGRRANPRCEVHDEGRPSGLESRTYACGCALTYRDYTERPQRPTILQPALPLEGAAD